MPAPEVNEQNAYAVVWPRTGTSPEGEVRVGAPYEVGVRWERVRSAGRTAEGAVTGTAGILTVSQPIPEDSLVFIGTLEDWYGAGSGSQPTQTAPLYQVESYDEVPDVKGREVAKECTLRRYRGRLPA